MKRFLIKAVSSLILSVVLAIGVGAPSKAVDKFGYSVSAKELNGTYCTMVIPPIFEPGTESGVFVNKSYPMESSIIRYNVYYNQKDIELTNREKQENAESAQTEKLVQTDKLTKEIYQESMSQAYNDSYGEDVGFLVSSFDKIEIDGCPGYKIVSEYQATDEEKIHQTVYMLVSRYRVFTITFQRAEDDDCESYFEECAATIRVH